MFFYDKLANNYAQKPNAEKIKIKEWFDENKYYGNGIGRDLSHDICPDV
jgi:hypothetical protein